MGDKKIQIKQKLLTGIRDIISVGGNSRGITIPKMWFDLREAQGATLPNEFLLIGHTEKDVIVLVPPTLEREANRLVRKLIKKLNKVVVPS